MDLRAAPRVRRAHYLAYDEPVAGPKTTVVVTCCNGEKYLGDQLRSIAAQTQLPDEVVVGDDASTDGSVDIAREVLDGLAADVQILTSRSRLGLATNLARCLERSTGEIVHFADHDDVWHPGKVARISEAFGTSPGAELVFSDGEVVDSNGRPTGRTLWSLVGFGAAERHQWAERPVGVLSRRTVVTGAAMAARRRLIEAALPLPDNCWHDEWLALCAVLRGTVPLALPDRLIGYRVHGSNLAGLPPRRARDRLVQAGWPRDSRVECWTEACERFGGGQASEQLRAAVAFARRRPGRSAPPIERLRRVALLSLAGDYRRYGKGWSMALHDLVAPALYGRR
jgi:cellulose synthase/poly-beta-1,6-N-acetylglucosamine synthase-like glycosyltransferase